MRKDAPSRLPQRRGSFPAFSGEEDLSAALTELREGFYAPSSRSSNASRLRTIEKALAAFRSPSWPLTVERIHMLAAILKRGHYASAAQYLSDYKLEAERQGQTMGGARDPRAQGLSPLL